MTDYLGTEGHDHSRQGCIGILLCNLGSPDAPTPAALRRYLAEFLWDPRVIEMPRPLWWLILHGIILRTRPKRSAHAYSSVWTEQGAPLIVTSQQQRDALQSLLTEKNGTLVKVEMAMRYGKPSISAGLRRLKEAGADRVLILPMYPQYSATTTASIYDAVVDELKGWRWWPELRLINHYHDDGGYIDALAHSIEEHVAAHGKPQRLLFSFHGMPKRYFTSGDPYYCECQKSARLVAERLGWSEDEWQLTFQSRFGKEEWLQPYTDQTLTELPKQGIKDVAVICPGFAADCLETLEEIAVENRNTFLKAGGERYHYIPALNDRNDHMAALAGLVQRHLQGWGKTEAEPAAARQARAVAMGAER